MPKVSVIVPNFNHSEYLERRLDSILNQSFQDFELIILDDNSTDRSRQIIERYRNKPKIAEIVYNTINSGNTFLQWKKGFDLAKGELIWIAESDDWCEPTLLETLVAPMQHDNSIVLSFCQTMFIGLQGNVIWKTQNPFLEEKKDGQTFTLESMMGTNAIPNASMALFRTSCLNLVDNGYLTMKYCGDWLFWTSICIQGKVFISGKYLNYYLRHNQNVATSAEKEGLDFTEGNIVFEYIMNHTNVKKEFVRKALKLKVERYFQLEPVFRDKIVKSKVLKSLEKIDDSFKSALLFRRIELGLKRGLSRVKRVFLQL